MKDKHLRITIVDVWHDDNKGDGGICEATLDLLQDVYPNAKLGVVSMFPADSPVFQSGHRHLIKRFPDIKVVPSLFSAYDPSGYKRRNHTLWTIWQLLISLIRLIPAVASKQPNFHLVTEADVILANGGQYLFTHQGHFNSLFHVFRLLYPIIIAKIHNVPYIFCSQSFSFYKSDRLDNKLVKAVMSAAQSVWVREEISRKELLNIGIPEPTIESVPDMAFALKPYMSNRVKDVLLAHELEYRSFWLITVRQWQDFTESFLDEMAVLVRQAIQTKMISKIVLVAHTIGPNQGGDDRIATQQLAQRLTSEIAQKTVVVVEDDLTPTELVAFYSQASLMIGTRFHSVIFSLVGGTPAYAISYSGPKTWGIMELLGMRQFCADMKGFLADKVLTGIKGMDLPQISAELPEKIATLRSELQEAITGLQEID